MNILLIHGKHLPIYNKHSRGAIEMLERIYLEHNELKGDKVTVYSPKIAKDNFDSKKLKNTSFRNIDLASAWSKFFRICYALKRRIVKSNNNEYYIRQVIKDIKKRGEENDYDLIIFENEEGSIPLFRKETNTKTRIALHLHNDYISVDRKNSEEILNNCDEVWCVSKFIESRVKEVKDIKTVVIPNTIRPLPAISSKEVARLKKKYNSDKNIIFLFVGRLLEVKGISELVDAFNIYNRKNKNAKLIIIGDFEKSIKNIKFARKMRSRFLSNQNIDAVGFKKEAEIANYYKIVDAQIVPSRWNEAFGLVTLEAMQGGVKIIASSHGAFREICGDYATYINKERMVRELICAMEAIKKEEKDKYRNCYSGILKQYTVQNFCNGYYEAIHDTK